MSDFHWGDEYFYGDRNRFVQAMRKRSALVMQTNPRWAAHMQRMAVELQTHKFHNNLELELSLSSKKLPTYEYARLARERIQFYLQEATDLDYHESKWSVY